MTRKKAILRAIEILRENPENDEIVQRLKEIRDSMPYTTWTKESILDAIDTFREERGRLPTNRDFKPENNLPSHPVISKKFQMGVGEFILQNYGIMAKDQEHEAYINQGDEYFKAVFMENYQRICEKYGVDRITMELYDSEREERTPKVKYILSKLGLKKYRELVKKCGFPKRKTLTVSTSYPEDVDLERITEVNQFLRGILEKSEKDKGRSEEE